MAYDSRVYRVLIASPSDVENERELAVRVIQEWNDLHSHNRKVVLLPLRWETHTAPAYGTRPQEVINRAIVDECDLLIGIFWSRFGSPTGEADSGTLEEIERVGKAGKPIMLYFSNMGIDPDKIVLEQLDRLQQFKQQTYPNSLTESYKSEIQFRDKFAKQLELKIRELQQTLDSGDPPLSLSFLALNTSKFLGDSFATAVTAPVVTDLAETMGQEADKRRQDAIGRVVKQRSREAVTVPLILAIRNASSAGVRDLYIEVIIRASNARVDISQKISRNPLPFYLTELWSDGTVQSLLESEVDRTIADLEQSYLQHPDNVSWRYSFEWGAIQPQRFRVVKPILFVASEESAHLDFIVTVFADNFPKPVALTATLDIAVQKTEVTVTELVPDLEAILAKILRRSNIAATTINPVLWQGSDS